MSKTPKQAPNATEEKIRLVRELAQVMEDNGLVEIDLEDESVSSQEKTNIDILNYVTETESFL